jgi:alkanesulfonate monooxygenase SsuD/methylene tetrahydromethanopterin reductase-like flavin-dependent oxidoreductase (luciferase family)
MEFGLFTEFPSPAGVTEAAAFDASLAQMKAAEDFGFDAVWLAEIHFQKDRSVLAAPLVIASALAACTRRVKIGIAVQVLPLSHPLRLAEDVATVDHIAKGRLEFGVGRSGLPGHYQGFNIPYSESRDRFVETLEILRKAWTQERFSHDGKYFQFNDVCIMPKPYQKPHPPIRVAASTPETYPMVARMGEPIFVAVRTVSITDLKRHLPTYQQAWTASGRPGRGNVGMSVPLYVAETPRQAREEAAAAVRCRELLALVGLAGRDDVTVLQLNGATGNFIQLGIGPRNDLRDRPRKRFRQRNAEDAPRVDRAECDLHDDAGHSDAPTIRCARSHVVSSGGGILEVAG